jgi:hypothetical protein
MQNRRTTLSLAATLVLAASLVACGGGSDDQPTALTVTPVLGAVYGASVTVFNGTTGAILGAGVTDATSGSAGILLQGTLTGPVVVRVSLTPGTKYYDEKLNQVVEISSSNQTSMLTVLPALPSTFIKWVGVTPISNMAAKLAGLDPASTSFSIKADKVNEGAARAVLALGLPQSFNITAPPVAAKSATFPTDVYGRLLAEMAKLAPTNALDQNKTLADAATAGTVMSSAALTAVTNALSSAAASVNTLKGAGTVAIAAPNLTPAPAALSAATTAQNTAISSGRVPTGATGASN